MEQAATPTSNNDVQTIEGLVNALYACVSGPAGSRDWPRFRHLFRPTGSLAWPTPIDPPGASLIVLTVDQFVETVGPSMSATDNWERELSRRVERFNHIAHVFSTYEARRSVEPTLSRGINSLQVFWDGQRWWITNIIFDFEGPAAPLPDVYVQNTGAPAAC
jgi:hypothetical protein